MRILAFSFLLLFLNILFLIPVSQAAELAGVKFPENIQVENSPLQLNGVGLRTATFLKVKVYAAGLYLEQKSNDVGAILASASKKRLVMQFVRSVGKEKIQNGWATGFEANNSDLSALGSRIKAFNGSMQKMEDGDRMVLDFLPGKVLVKVKQVAPLAIEGDDFSRALLKIWLGKKPPNKGLKKGLLGL